MLWATVDSNNVRGAVSTTVLTSGTLQPVCRECHVACQQAAVGVFADGKLVLEPLSCW